MRAGRVLWPRNPITPSWVRTSTVPGMCLGTKFDLSGQLTVLLIQHPQPLLPFLGPHRGEQMAAAAKETQTAIVFALWQSRCPTTHLYQASTVSARRRGCVSTLTSGPKASLWACLLVSPWLGKVRYTLIKVYLIFTAMWLHVGIFFTLKMCLVLSYYDRWRKKCEQGQGTEYILRHWKWIDVEPVFWFNC